MWQTHYQRDHEPDDLGCLLILILFAFVVTGLFAAAAVVLSRTPPGASI